MSKRISACCGKEHEIDNREDISEDEVAGLMNVEPYK